MFKFSKVKDLRSGKAYMVTKAVLAGDGYNWELDGSNWYHVELQPEDVDEMPFPSVDVIIANDGNVRISQNLHGDRYEKRLDELLNVSIREAITVAAILDGETLIIPEVDEDTEGNALVFHEVCEAAELKHLSDSQVYLIEDVEDEDTTTAIQIVFKWPGHEQQLRIQENGELFLSNPY